MGFVVEPASEPPNTLIVCNLCSKEITSCCMLSPDVSLHSQFDGAMYAMREHFKKEHNMEKPMDGKWSIYVNCKKYEWTYAEISYEDLQKIHKGFTVMFTNGSLRHPNGTLTKGEKVEVVDGIRFDVHDTGNA